MRMTFGKVACLFLAIVAIPLVVLRDNVAGKVRLRNSQIDAWSKKVQSLQREIGRVRVYESIVAEMLFDGMKSLELSARTVLDNLASSHQIMDMKIDFLEYDGEEISYDDDIVRVIRMKVVLIAEDSDQLVSFVDDLVDYMPDNYLLSSALMDKGDVYPEVELVVDCYVIYAD